jgi:hypothetical protein
MGQLGRNFLASHRMYLLRFEERLRDAGSGVAIPYWDPVTDPAIPRANKKALVEKWGIAREWSKDLLPSKKALDAVVERTKFKPFQLHLESFHNLIHRAVGGDMSTSASPGDPIFWLHHANIDRLWAEWQKKHRAARPSNADKKLKPSSMFGMPVCRTRCASGRSATATPDCGPRPRDLAAVAAHRAVCPGDVRLGLD